MLRKRILVIIAAFLLLSYGPRAYHRAMTVELFLLPVPPGDYGSDGADIFAINAVQSIAPALTAHSIARWFIVSYGDGPSSSIIEYRLIYDRRAGTIQEWGRPSSPEWSFPGFPGIHTHYDWSPEISAKNVNDRRIQEAAQRRDWVEPVSPAF